MADFRSVYHLAYSDALRLPAEEFLALAYRLPVYSGVIAMRAEAQQKAQRRNVPIGARMVSESHSEFSDVIEFN